MRSKAFFGRFFSVIASAVTDLLHEKPFPPLFVNNGYAFHYKLALISQKYPFPISNPTNTPPFPAVPTLLMSVFILDSRSPSRDPRIALVLYNVTPLNIAYCLWCFPYVFVSFQWCVFVCFSVPGLIYVSGFPILDWHFDFLLFLQMIIHSLFLLLSDKMF